MLTCYSYSASGLLYLRARTYAPRLGVFTALDPYEGSAARPMSLNCYAWVEGNVANAVDPSGWIPIAPPPMPYDEFVRWMAGGAAAAAALCTGPQAAICATLAGTAFLVAGGTAALYTALVNSNWDAHRAYESVIASANLGLHPQVPDITATPGAPARPGYYPDERFNENPFAGAPMYVRPDPQQAPDPEPPPTPATLVDPFFVPPDCCTPTPTSTPRPSQQHIALGKQWADPPLSRLLLMPFVINLNAMLNPSGISVHMFAAAIGRNPTGPGAISVGGWQEAGLTRESVRIAMFDSIFLSVAAAARGIHFNLEGITEDYIAYASSSNGYFGVGLSNGADITATELHLVRRDPALCQKTEFYLRGSQYPPIPDPASKAQICGA